jgi:uncharacterized integral membrane protein
MTMSSVWVIRWVLFALSAVLALVLMINGNVVIGALIGAMVLVRVVLFFQLRHRRDEIRARIAQRRGIIDVP